MWIRKAPYDVKLPLPEITRHDRLPSGAIEIATIVESTERDLFY